ncbi:hypothetical protein F442_02963 [Phytophthora nicotianae P10297]|uniref:Uncharacterized protein n=1 Tax=Phytophthora nicotianae P10297 TaxID=1317064 RepID=W2ZY65_PHYNI|nr:hypothetical protein F442_02963 [Phytophthora nicotianae P10297]
MPSPRKTDKEPIHHEYVGIPTSLHVVPLLRAGYENVMYLKQPLHPKFYKTRKTLLFVNMFGQPDLARFWNNGYVVGRVTQTDIATLRESFKETEWEIADGFWHALTSLTGGDAQAAHKDFPTFETAHAQLRKGMPPAFVIMAFMGETPLHTHPGRADCRGA